MSDWIVSLINWSIAAFVSTRLLHSGVYIDTMSSFLIVLSWSSILLITFSASFIQSAVSLVLLSITDLNALLIAERTVSLSLLGNTTCDHGVISGVSTHCPVETNVALSALSWHLFSYVTLIGSQGVVTHCTCLDPHTGANSLVQMVMSCAWSTDRYAVAMRLAVMMRRDVSCMTNTGILIKNYQQNDEKNLILFMCVCWYWYHISQRMRWVFVTLYTIHVCLFTMLLRWCYDVRGYPWVPKMLRSLKVLGVIILLSSLLLLWSDCAVHRYNPHWNTRLLWSLVQIQ